MYTNVMLSLAQVLNKMNVPFFSRLRYSNKIEIVTAFKCIFEEAVPKLLVNFGNHNSRDSHNNRSPSPVWNFGFTDQIYGVILIEFAAKVPYLSHW